MKILYELSALEYKLDQIKKEYCCHVGFGLSPYVVESEGLPRKMKIKLWVRVLALSQEDKRYESEVGNQRLPAAIDYSIYDLFENHVNDVANFEALNLLLDKKYFNDEE